MASRHDLTARIGLGTGFRHAMLLLKAGIPVHVVSKRLRHSRIQITLDYYAHVISDQDAAVAVNFEALMGYSDSCADDAVHIFCTFEAEKAAEAAPQ